MSIEILEKHGTTWQESSWNQFTFPAGEPHVYVPTPKLSVPLVVFRPGGDCTEYLKLMEIAEVYRRNNDLFNLYIPYVPGGRQDRVTSKEEPFTLKVVADLINSLGASRVYILDPHSDVTPALINNVQVVPVVPFIKNFAAKGKTTYVGVIAPDAGAEKRAYAAAKALNLPLFQAGKTRDTETGKLSGFVVPHLTGKKERTGHYLVVDDICDAGGTFIGLSDAMSEDYPLATMDLWVTHGFFTKGPTKLNAAFERIGTTDSRHQVYPHLVDVFNVTV